MIKKSFHVVKVRYQGGAYTTATVRGQRASSTSNPDQAALKLAQRLYGVQAAVRAETPADAPCATYFFRIAPSLGALE